MAFFTKYEKDQSLRESNTLVEKYLESNTMSYAIWESRVLNGLWGNSTWIWEVRLVEYTGLPSKEKEDYTGSPLCTMSRYIKQIFRDPYTLYQY